MTTEFTEISLRIEPEGYAVLTLNRPERLNTLTIAMRREIAAAVEMLEGVHALILTGAGKAFSAGLDLSEWDTPGAPCSGAYAHDPVAALARFRGPVVGAINGLAVTGGLELALACDFLIASETARFADTHCLVGLLPGWGGSVRLLHRIGIARAKEMALTGRFVPAREALDWGLVNHVYPAADLPAEAEALARQLVHGVAATRADYKALLEAELDAPFAQALRIERARSVAANTPVDAADLARRLERLKGRG